MFEDLVGPEAVAGLAAVVPADLDDANLIEVMQSWERLASWVAAGQLAAIAELARRRPRDYVDTGPGHLDRGDPGVPQISEFAVDEVASALRLTRPTAGMRVQLAVELAGRLAATATALRAGSIDVPKARAIVDAVTGLDDTLATAVQERVLPRAGQQTTGQLRASLSRAVLANDPAAAEIRHRQAVAGRLVTVRPLADGMAGLWALLPADGAAALYARLDRLARRAAADDPRPMDARRADALLALTLTDATTDATTDVTPTRGDTAGPPPVPARVHVTVSAGTALGLADQPGHLAGHGPVPASMARRLAATGAWRKVTIDPATGAATDVGRTRYTPSAALADLIRTRDITCRFPGCRQPAHCCDIDHVTPWPTGPTTAANLATLCRHHHRLKHRTNWQVEADDPATLTWTSPTGHRYTTTAGPDP
ncbi:MAG: DUF222 domain-containing protein [Mycobacteriales bacterium]